MAWDPNSLASWIWDTDAPILLQHGDGTCSTSTENQPLAAAVAISLHGSDGKCNRSTESQCSAAAIGGLPGNDPASYPAGVSTSFHDTCPSVRIHAAEATPFKRRGGAIGGDHGNWNLGGDSKHFTLKDRSLGLKSYESAECGTNVEEQGTEKDRGPSIFTEERQTRLVLGDEENHQRSQDQKHHTPTGSGMSGESQESAPEWHHRPVPDTGLNKGVLHKPASGRKLSESASQMPCCQVDGCEADLSLSSKGYHRRHKVCELHSKANKVTVKGQEQRFCQQCSRFHALAEFDEAKRSCRRRLAGHNERRRKPQSETLALNTRLRPAFEDQSFNHFRFRGLSLPWEDSASAVSLRARMQKHEGHLMFDYASLHASDLDLQFPIKNLYSGCNRSDKCPLFLLQSPKLTMPQGLCSQSVPNHNYHGGDENHGSNRTSSGAAVLSGLDFSLISQPVTRVSDSGCALSLLSPHSLLGHDHNVVSQGLSSWMSSNLNQLVNEGSTEQQHEFSGGQQNMEISGEKMTLVVPSAYKNSSMTRSFSVLSKSMGLVDKYEHSGGSLMSGMNENNSLDSSLFPGGLPDDYEPRDMRPTRVLWQTPMSEAPSSSVPQGQTLGFQHASGDNAAAGHLQFLCGNLFDSHRSF